MLAAALNFIPTITSEAGLCLTGENWNEAKITTVSCSLEFLLYKPGLEVLKKINNLSSYLGWSGTLILNAASLVPNREGAYLLKSPYDGAKIKLTSLELIELIQHLKPNAVILPKNIIQDCPSILNNWLDFITPFFAAPDLLQFEVARPHGVYFTSVNESVLEKLDTWTHLPRYVIGDLHFQLIQDLHRNGIKYIETDIPAKDALNGIVYSSTENVDLTQTRTQLQFEAIDPDCVCPVCSQKFTKAYLHHLLHHTPLLCQRFLIQHNVFWVANELLPKMPHADLKSLHEA